MGESRSGIAEARGEDLSQELLDVLVIFGAIGFVFWIVGRKLKGTKTGDGLVELGRALWKGLTIGAASLYACASAGIIRMWEAWQSRKSK